MCKTSDMVTMQEMDAIWAKFMQPLADSDNITSLSAVKTEVTLCSERFDDAGGRFDAMEK